MSMEPDLNIRMSPGLLDQLPPDRLYAIIRKFVAQNPPGDFFLDEGDVIAMEDMSDPQRPLLIGTREDYQMWEDMDTMRSIFKKVRPSLRLQKELKEEEP